MSRTNVKEYRGQICDFRQARSARIRPPVYPLVGVTSESFVMSPHPQNLDGLFLFNNLIDQAMLNVDAATNSGD